MFVSVLLITTRLCESLIDEKLSINNLIVDDNTDKDRIVQNNIDYNSALNTRNLTNNCNINQSPKNCSLFKKYSLENNYIQNTGKYNFFFDKTNNKRFYNNYNKTTSNIRDHTIIPLNTIESKVNNNKIKNTKESYKLLEDSVLNNNKSCYANNELNKKSSGFKNNSFVNNNNNNIHIHIPNNNINNSINILNSNLIPNLNEKSIKYDNNSCKDIVYKDNNGNYYSKYHSLYNINKPMSLAVSIPEEFSIDKYFLNKNYNLSDKCVNYNTFYKKYCLDENNSFKDNISNNVLDSKFKIEDYNINVNTSTSMVINNCNTSVNKYNDERKKLSITPQTYSKILNLNNSNNITKNNSSLLYQNHSNFNLLPYNNNLNTSNLFTKIIESECDNQLGFKSDYKMKSSYNNLNPIIPKNINISSINNTKENPLQSTLKDIQEVHEYDNNEYRGKKSEAENSINLKTQNSISNLDLNNLKHNYTNKKSNYSNFNNNPNHFLNKDQESKSNIKFNLIHIFPKNIYITFCDILYIYSCELYKLNRLIEHIQVEKFIRILSNGLKLDKYHSLCNVVNVESSLHNNNIENKNNSSIISSFNFSPTNKIKTVLNSLNNHTNINKNNYKVNNYSLSLKSNKEHKISAKSNKFPLSFKYLFPKNIKTSVGNNFLGKVNYKENLFNESNKSNINTKQDLGMNIALNSRELIFKETLLISNTTDDNLLKNSESNYRLTCDICGELIKLGEFSVASYKYLVQGHFDHVINYINNLNN